MFQLTKEMLDQLRYLPDSACISGTEMSRITGLCPKQLGGLVKAKHFPTAVHIVPKHMIGTVSRKKYWRLGELRKFVELGRDKYLLQNIDKQKTYTTLKSL